jgi:hypothetical protein
VISAEDWAEIRRLHRAEGMGRATIARRLGLSRNKVRGTLRADDAPRCQWAAKGSMWTASSPACCGCLREFPNMPASCAATAGQHCPLLRREQLPDAAIVALATRRPGWQHRRNEWGGTSSSSLIRLRWSSGAETTVVPATGALTVLTAGEGALQTAAKRKGTVRSEAGAAQKTAGKSATRTTSATKKTKGS